MDLGNSISLLFCIPFLGIAAQYRGFPAGKTGLVGEKSEVCGYRMVTAVSDPVCNPLRFGVMGEQFTGSNCR